MSSYKPVVSILVGLALLCFSSLLIIVEQKTMQLQDTNSVTGYTLFTLILLLLLFSLRKRLSMIPLLRAVWWTYFHAITGVLSLLIFWLHIGLTWPTGYYEQLLTILFHLVSISGILGYLIQRWSPSALTHNGNELIYERIPLELHNILKRSNTLVLECTQQTQSETIAKHYMETLSDFLVKPKNIFRHILGSRAGSAWIQQNFSSIESYLNDQEKIYHNELMRLFKEKNSIDFQYAHQRLLKVWLLLHIPAALAVLILATWHLLIVNIYSL